MGKNKDKKADKSLNESQTNGEAKDEVSYEDRLKFVSVISKPMASKKLAKKVSLLCEFLYKKNTHEFAVKLF